ncbi:MAG TPA: hypothetical protein VJ727_05645 [Rhodanobacteraceae bacterium]|nr:hypothetical protein [Rhodanobacteraceae bacterium]
MQWEFKEWTFELSWKLITYQLLTGAAVGKLCSIWFHLGWLACAFWILALYWFIHACTAYGEASLSYFDDRTGKFKPRFGKRVRVEIFAVFAAVSLAFAAAGLFAQLHSN